VFTDPIPANTSYFPESITLNGAALTDVADADVGAYTATPTPEVSVGLGDLVETSGAQTIEFTVIID